MFILKSLRHIVVRSELALDDTNPEEELKKKQLQQQ
jgi:hypothetical protein